MQRRLHAPAVRDPRVTESDREHTLTELRDAYAFGALTLEELIERVELALVANSVSELEETLAGLAVPRSPSVARREIRGFFGTNSLGGRWRMTSGTRVRALFGTCKVDLSQAELEASRSDVVELDAEVLFGTIKLDVPRGVRVEVEGSPTFGSHKIAAGGRALDGVPVIRIRARTRFGTLKVRGA